ncbi:unnamed protein product [Echinostoma caproni]|uniref:Uncharacterized protein n=1 Tax=Echinostoma caproni TaxID=27848 RepID=A0A3P8HH20_9TREM|nr:unnamed protein product [Echinostoma caproni]
MINQSLPDMDDITLDGPEVNGVSPTDSTVMISSEPERGQIKDRSKALKKIVSFCALVPSLKPSVVYEHESIETVEDRASQSPLSDRYFDEFGFRIDDLDALSSKYSMSYVRKIAKSSCCVLVEYLGIQLGH